MEMFPKSGAVVLVGMADKQGVHVEPAIAIGFKTLAEGRGDVRRVVIQIVGRGSDVQVYKYLATGFCFPERHVTVTNWKKRESCSHFFNPWVWGSI